MPLQPCRVHRWRIVKANVAFGRTHGCSALRGPWPSSACLPWVCQGTEDLAAIKAQGVVHPVCYPASRLLGIWVCLTLGLLRGVVWQRGPLAASHQGVQAPDCGKSDPSPGLLDARDHAAPWWMSMAAVWFGIWDGMISLSSPSTLCLSSFASLRCSVSCLALSHGRPQSQHVDPAERANVFGVVLQVETHDCSLGARRYDLAFMMWIGSSRALLRLRSSCARP
ncbi:Hypothetical protein DHA2_154369 [Giardia duodenalis]|uniref:Uncharacterized protein n=1 Tax=Giardia intestinalis TaxID=5741 RepID=V6TD22_GIAIN|nr:Hypothetical protein DHA2_154369 [Giardia intestinalis]